MQYLYVLTSTPNDYYYEQFLLSAVSLNLCMPDANVILLCDAKTKDTLTGKREAYQEFIFQTVTADVPPDLSQTEIFRWLKTSMRRLVPGDFLYIDCDTIITEDLSSITETGRKFGACLDKHSSRHFNGGILYCPDTPETHKIFERWHELWLSCKSRNISGDMPSLNMAIYENSSSFTELDGIWNCQIAFNGLPFLANSKIIHYFASDPVLRKSPFIPASDEILIKIKNTGKIPDEVYELLKNPRAAFYPELRIISGDEMLDVFNSSLFDILFLISIKIPLLFKFFNQIAKFLKKTGKYFLVKISRKKDGGIKYYN